MSPIGTKSVRTTRRLLASISTLALTACAAAAAPAVVQTVPPPSEVSQEPSSTVQEIVVTAQRREQNLQDVPISVTALNEDYLEANNVNSLEDLAGAIPNFVVTNNISYGNAPITIRGVGGPSGGGSLFNDEPVAVYIDGVYVSQLGQSVSDLPDVASIQVLRGPQGTLYGRNSTAGAVLITTQRPTDEFEAIARVRVSSYDNYRASVAASGPIAGETLTGRIVVAYHDGGYWATNTFDGGEIGGSNDISGRVSLRYRPTEDLTFDLIADTSRSKSKPVTFGLTQVTLRPSGPVLGTPYVGDPFARRSDYAAVLEGDEFYLDSPQFSVSRATDLTLLAEWDLGRGLTLNSITGYRRFKVSGGQDGEGLQTIRRLDDNAATQRAENLSQELRLSSSDNERFDWTIGAYAEHQDNDIAITINNYQGGPPVFARNPSPLGGPPVPQGRIAGTAASFNGTQSLDAFALFADGTLKLTDRLSLIAGARYSPENKSVGIRQIVQTIQPTVTVGPVLSTAACPSANTSCEVSFDDFSPRIVLNYELTPRTLLYASYSKGFKSGGFNTFGNVANPLDPANPLQTREEAIDAFELGAKNEFFDRRLRLNANAFFYDYGDLQIREAVFTGGVSIVNVPKAEVKGVEIEATLVPIENLTITANASYLDAELKEGSLAAVPTNVGTIIYGQNLALGLQDVSGARMTRSPEYQAYAAVNYKLPTSYGEFEFNAALKYQSSVYFLEVNQDSDIYKGAAWREVDLRAAFTDRSGRYEFAVFADNVFDNRHLTQVAPFVGFPIGVINPPRSIGLALTARY